MVWVEKYGLAKAAGAEPAGQTRGEKLHAVVVRSTFPSQNAKNTRGSDHFWKLRCRKSARRCGAKHISKSKCTKHTRGSDHFWKLRCPKSARRCGAKHISKSKCTKHLSSGPLLEVAMSKKCTPLWREARFQVKSVKNWRPRTTFFWRFRCQKSARRCGAKHISKSKCSDTRVSDHFWRFRCRFASFHYTTLHYTTLHSTTLHYITLHSTTLQVQLHNYTTTQLHNYIALDSTTLNYTPLHSTTLNYTTVHYTTLHSTTLHYTTLHYIPAQ